MRIHRKNCPEGFSLLEVIISLGIAAISVSSLIIFFTYALQNIRVTRSMAQATILAQRTIEDLKSDPTRILEMADDPAYVAGPVETAEILYKPETFELGSPRIPIPFFYHYYRRADPGNPRTGNRHSGGSKVAVSEPV